VALGEAVGLPWLGELATDALEFQKLGNPQAYGLGVNPNPVGMYLAIASVLAFGFFLLHSSNRLMKGLTLLLFLTILVGMLATFSRSALLGWFIAISVVAFLALAGSEVRRVLVFQRIGIVALIVGIMLIAGVVIDPGGAGTRGISGVQRFTSGNVATGFNYMVNDFEASIPIIQDNFIRGVGAGNYPQALTETLSDDARNSHTVPVHNVFLLTFAEVGIVGGLAWIAITLAPIVWILQHRRSPDFDTRTLIWVGPVLVLLFESLQDSTPWATQDGRVLMWAMLAMWVGALLAQRPRPAPDEEDDLSALDASTLLPTGH
jgi:O-antigen ligase